MLKLLLFGLILFSVYRFFSRLGRLEEKVDTISKKEDGKVADRKDKRKEGEYIDFEEIK